MISGLNSYVSFLETKEELVRINIPVNTKLEITEIVDRVSKSEGGGKALLFESNGTAFPLLINTFGSERRMSLALGHESLEKIGEEIESLFKQLSGPASSWIDKLRRLPLLRKVASWMPKSVSGKGVCQEVVMSQPDLYQLPVLTCWPADGGPFITLPCVITRDPETGIRNVGMYRMQIFDALTTGMHWHRHKTGARHFAAYKKMGKRMPVAVVLGGDPVYTYAATAPLPDQVDEFMLAGFLRKRSVRLVKCITNDLEVPEDADFVIEGYVDPDEQFAWEGPFGDHTGFYSLADWYPKFHVTAITHRKNAVYPATIVGIPSQEDAYIGLATEKIFLTPMKLTLIPELKGMYLPPAGVAHNLTIIQIDKTYPGQAIKTINAMWGAGQMMFNKIMIVADENVDLKNGIALGRSVSKQTNPAFDICFSKGPMDVLDHSASKFAYGSKLGIDATRKFNEEISEKDILIKLPEVSEFGSIVSEVHGLISINTDLLQYEISAIVFGYLKDSPNAFDAIKDQLLQNKAIQKIKFLFFVDGELPIHNLEAVAWYLTGNIDPERDCKIIKAKAEGEVNHLIVDGTRKSKLIDGFLRDWPNPVLSSQDTINKIDALWSELGLGEFIESPSLTFFPLKRGEGAIAE